MTTTTFPEQRTAGENAAAIGIADAIKAGDTAFVVRRYLMVAASYGADSPAVLAFVSELARRLMVTP